MPMVIEAHGGGLGSEFRQILDSIAKQTAAVSGLRTDFHSLLIAQRISVTLQKENARAILRRCTEPLEGVVQRSVERPAVSPSDLWEFQ